MLFTARMDLDGIPDKADFGNDFYILSDYLGIDGYSDVRVYSRAVKENYASAPAKRGVRKMNKGKSRLCKQSDFKACLKQQRIIQRPLF